MVRCTHSDGRLMTDEGKILHGYEGRHCALDTCRIPLTEQTEAYLHKDRETGQLLMFCGDCSIHVSIQLPLRLPRVNL